MANLFEQALNNCGDSYLPVYGSTITPDAFTLNENGRWEVTLAAPNGGQSRYEWDAATKDCFRDGSQFQLEHPHSGVPLTPDSLDWFDFIARTQVELEAEQISSLGWGSGDIDTTLLKAEHSIVSFSSKDFSPLFWTSPEALEQAVNKFLCSTPLRVEVQAVSNWAPSPSYFISDEGPDKFCAIMYGSQSEPETWMQELEEFPYNPNVWLRYDGTTLMTKEGGVCFRTSEVPETVEYSHSNSSPWWLITCQETDISLLLSVKSTVLVVDWDDDGQSVVLSVRPAQSRTLECSLIDRYERQWGHLLDDDAPHSERDIKAAIQAAHQLISEEHNG